MSTFPLRVLTTTALCTNFALAQQAQDLQKVQHGLALEEIVVTAQRREQNLQDVPVSVTAFSGDVLERANITQARDYLALTPNVGFSDGEEAGSRAVSISIRGVNDLKSGQNSVTSSIGIYLDEFSVVSSSSRSAVNPNLRDLERVEVLRGPQGTYFGRNSLGGALNLTTKAPTDVFEGEINIGGETYDTRGHMGQGSLILNIPMSDELSFRGVAQYEDHSGMVENITPTGSDTGGDYFMGRGTLLYTPSDRTTVKFMAMYTDESQDGDESIPSGVWNIDTIDGYVLGVAGGVSDLVDPVNTEGIGFYPDNRDKNSRDLDEFNDTETTIAILNISHQVSDDLVLKSITGVYDSEWERLQDTDQLGGWDNFYTEESGDSLSYSTEFRAEYTGSNFEWVVGGLYAKDEQDRTFYVVAGSNFAAPVGPTGPNDPDGVVLLSNIAEHVPPGLCFQCDNKTFEATSVAVFTDFSWHLTDQLDVILGGRYTRDDIESSLASTGPFRTDNTVLALAKGKEEFSDFSPRFVVRYQVNDDVSVYGSVTKGYKAGGTSLGFNPDIVAVPSLPEVIEVPFDDETLWNYEVGFKSELFDKRLRINAAAFYLDWSDLQLESYRFLVPGNLSSKFALTANMDEAEAKGFEVEVAAVVTDRFSISGGIGYLESEVTKSDPQELSGGFIVDLTGLTIPKSPEWTANLVGEYRLPIGDGEAWGRIEYIYRDSQTSNLEGMAWKQVRGQFLPNSTAEDPAFASATPNGFPFVAPSYDLINLRAGYEWNQFSINFYVNNLTDEDYYTSTSEDYGLGGIRIRPHPRTYGGSITYRFGSN